MWCASVHINLKGIVHFDEAIRAADGTSIMGHWMRDSFYVHKDLSHFVQLVLGLLGCKMKKSKATLGATDQTEILLLLVSADDLPKTAE